MKRIKEEERQRGRATAITEMNTEAKRLGFRSHEDMVKHVSQQRNKPKAAAAQPQQPAADGDVRESPRKLNALEREVQRLTDERKRQNRRVADLEKENKRLRTQIDAKEAESTLRVSAARHGVKDVEYALHVCRAACSGKSEDELRSFDEDRFFGETLRRTHPYLYAVEERPATTAPNAASQGRPEAPQAAPAVDPTAAGVDARKLSPAEYQELLRKRGLADPLVNAYAG
jgi:phage host-nuclease inhibitor protein Gam